MDEATSCLQSQIGQDLYLSHRGATQVMPDVVLSVAVRLGPVMAAVNGTLVARPARTTWLGAAAMGSSFSDGGGPSRATRASLATAPQEGAAALARRASPFPIQATPTRP